MSYDEGTYDSGTYDDLTFTEAVTPAGIRGEMSTSDPYATPFWIEMPAIKSLTVQQGATSGFDATPQSQSMTVEWDNTDRMLDPANAGATRVDFLTPQRRVRVLIDHAELDAETDLCHGWAKDWQQNIRVMDGTAVTDCRDWLALLGDRPLLSSPYAVEVLADAPYAWYRMDETAGTVMLDSSGNSRHGYWEGNALEHSTTSLLTDSGHAVAFDGDDDAARSSVGASHIAAFECWFQGTDITQAVLFECGDQSGYTTRAYISAGGILVADTTDIWVADVSIFFTRQFDNGRPHHVAFIYADQTFVVDGEEIPAAATGSPGAAAYTRDELAVGRFLNHSWPPIVAPFVMDELAVYDTAPSVARFQTHYAAGTTAWDLDTTGARIGRALDAAGQLAADRNLDDGQRRLGPAALGTTAGNYLQRVTRTEQGRLYQQPDGKIRFRARGTREPEVLRASTVTYVDSSPTYTPNETGVVTAASDGVDITTFAGAGVIHLDAVNDFTAPGTLYYLEDGPAVITYTGKSSSGGDPRLTGCTLVSGSGTLTLGHVVASFLPYDEGRRYTVTTPGLPDLTAYVSRRDPTVTSVGWVAFLSQAYGTSDWTGGAEKDAKENAIVVNLTERGRGVLAIKWADPGWLVAPFGAHVGERQLSSRPAALLRFLWDEFVAPDVNDFIITGQSAGSSQVAYALTTWGLKDIVKRAVLTAGPPHAQIAKLAGPLGTDYIASDPAVTILDASEGEYDPLTSAGLGLGPAQLRVEDGWWRREWRDQSCGLNPTDDMEWTGVTVAGLFGEDDLGSSSCMHDFFALLRANGQTAPRAVGPGDHPISFDRLSRFWPLVHDEPVPLCVSPRVNNAATTTFLLVDIVANAIVAGTDMVPVGAPLYLFHLAETAHANMAVAGIGWSEIDTWTIGSNTVRVLEKISDGTDDSVIVTATGSVHQEACVVVGWVPGTGTPTVDLAYSQSDTGFGTAGTGALTVGPTSAPAVDDELAIVCVSLGTAGGGWTDFTPAMADYGFARDFAGDRMIVGTVGIHDGAALTTTIEWANVRASESRIYTVQDL